jgi:phage baseplate assembly protein W
MAYVKVYSLQDFTPNVAVGIKLPLVGVRGNLFDQSYSTEEQVLSNVKNLILTEQGERILQPRFGTRLRRAVFSQNTETLKEEISTSISDAIAFWLPYVNIVNLTIDTVIATGANISEHGVKISLQVSINGQVSETPLTFLITRTASLEI